MYRWKKKEFLRWKKAKILFQKRPFCNVLIKKSRIKRLKNTNLLHEIPFYGDLSIKQISEVFTNRLKNTLALLKAR